MANGWGRNTWGSDVWNGEPNLTEGWGFNGWGETVWGDNYQIELTGVQADTAVGTVDISAGGNISVNVSEHTLNSFIGQAISDAGAILHLRHKIASNYDYYVNNYPHVWLANIDSRSLRN